MVSSAWMAASSGSRPMNDVRGAGKHAGFGWAIGALTAGEGSGRAACSTRA